MHNDRSKTLVPCYKDVDPYDMPPEFKNLQGQDMSKLGFIQDLTRGITKIIRGSVEKSTVTTSAPTGALTKRGYFFLEDGDYKGADEYFDKALDENPEDSKAYVGKVLAGLHMKDAAEIDDNFVKLYEDKNFERAIRFASGTDKAQLEEIKETADRKWFIKRLTVGLVNIAKKKETQEVQDKVAQLCASATVEGYQEAYTLIQDAYDRKVNKGIFSSSLVESYKRQVKILTLLISTYEDYTIHQIRENECFDGPYYSTYDCEVDVRRMVDAGSVEQGLESGSYCIVGSVAKRKQLRNEQEYARADELAKSSVQTKDFNGCFTAVKIYESLGEYMDSQSKATEYLALGNRFKHEYEAEQARQEAERKAAEEKRLAEIREHNAKINSQIADLERQLGEQNRIHSENAGKIFGAGAKLKKAAKAEIDRLESEISNIKRQLK